MKSIVATITLTLVGLVVVPSPAGAKPPVGKKTTICHFTGKKYLAITVSNHALAQHVKAHNDITDPTVVPQNNAAAAKAYCTSQPVLTPTRGGTKGTTKLSSGTLAATLGLRLRVGQGALCYILKVAQTPAASLTVSSVTLTPTSGSPLTLDLSGLTTTGTTPLTLSKCQAVSRATVKSLLQNRSSYTVSVVTTAGMLTAPLGA